MSNRKLLRKRKLRFMTLFMTALMLLTNTGIISAAAQEIPDIDEGYAVINEDEDGTAEGNGFFNEVMDAVYNPVLDGDGASGDPT
ncbi:MAG: hypothetical protein K6E63_08945, partial [Lachnospiraceae bacterium]|nr:hypothetical protein [Lachnospiraceae bacterium]